MAWYDNAVFYHIYPLGLCGCAHENDGQAVPGAFNKLNAWAEHAADIGCTAIYIGPLFESGSHGYDTIDYRLVDRRLGTNAEFKDFVARCHARGQKVIVDPDGHLMGCFGAALLAADAPVLRSEPFMFNIDDFEFRTREVVCGHCANHCEIVCVYRDQDLIDSWGNRCDRGAIRPKPKSAVA